MLNLLSPPPPIATLHVTVWGESETVSVSNVSVAYQQQAVLAAL